MKVFRQPEKLQSTIKKLGKNKKVGFVPTMGALHEGHLSLIKKAGQENDLVVVSIFVNPAQFGPGEDLKKYPRPLKKDLALLKNNRVDFVFLPDEKTMYPQGYATFISVEALSNLLCGKNRPGHFRGVATIVAKLINIVRPDTLYLGQKDAQQAVILKRMTEDLNIPLEVKVMPIIRRKDGLALSSRNIYLTKKQQVEATALFKSLSLAKALIEKGQRHPNRIILKMKALLEKKQVKIDYVEIVDLKSLGKIKMIKGDCLIALAARFGDTRLIDNIIVHV